MVSTPTATPAPRPHNRIARAALNGEGSHHPTADEGAKDVQLPEDSPASADVEDHDQTASLLDEVIPDSLSELAAAINTSHRRYGRRHQRANEAALRTGQLLVAGKQKLRGLWNAWCGDHLEIGERQIERYMKLFRDRKKLNKLNRKWTSEWSMSEALDRLAEQTAHERESAKARDRHHPDFHPLSAIKPLPDPTPRTLDKVLLNAIEAHEQDLAELQTLRDDGALVFEPDSPESFAVRALGEGLVQSARHVAGQLRAACVAANRYREGTVALALTEELLQMTATELFQPQEDDVPRLYREQFVGAA